MSAPEWLLTSTPLGLASLTHMLLFGILLPLGAWVSLRRLAQSPLPARPAYYAGVIAQQTVFAIVALWVARSNGIRVFAGGDVGLRAVGLGVAMWLIAVTTLGPLWARQVRRGERLVHLMSPRTTTERWLWSGVSLAAGVAEEVAYRGVLFAIVAALIGVVPAAVTCAVVFALGHLAQGWRSVPVVFGFALGFHALVWLSDTLWIAMAVHFAYDLTAGLCYGRLAARYGYPVESMAATPGEGAAATTDAAARTPS